MNKLNTIGNLLRDISYHKQRAHEDVEGVMNAEVLIVIMDSGVKYYSYRGTFTEIGIALGRGIPIILYNPWIDASDINDMAKYSRNVTNVFFWHDNITRVTTGNQVYRELEKLST
jgi:nucleoside 2-deoxyribosyltransferase